MGGHSGARGVCARNRVAEHVGGPARGDVTYLAIDPIADDLHPRRPVTARSSSLRFGVLRQLAGLYLHCVVTDVPASTREVAAGMHHAWQIVGIVELVMCVRHSGVAQEQRTRV